MKIYIPYYFNDCFEYTLKAYKSWELAFESITKHLKNEPGTCSIRYMILEIEVEG